MAGYIMVAVWNSGASYTSHSIWCPLPVAAPGCKWPVGLIAKLILWKISKD